MFITAGSNEQNAVMNKTLVYKTLLCAYTKIATIFLAFCAFKFKWALLWPPNKMSSDNSDETGWQKMAYLGVKIGPFNQLAVNESNSYEKCSQF